MFRSTLQDLTAVVTLRTITLLKLLALSSSFALTSGVVEQDFDCHGMNLNRYYVSECISKSINNRSHISEIFFGKTSLNFTKIKVNFQ